MKNALKRNIPVVCKFIIFIVIMFLSTNHVVNK